MKISILIIFTLSFSFLEGFSQIFDQSQTPLSVNWKQIEHSGFKIIYPTPLEKQAQRMANTLAYIYPSVGRSLREVKTTIPIVLQNQGTTSNGFVQLAPKKSQFYTMPAQDFDNQDWLNNLAVHELRHVAQFNKLTGKTGFPFPEEIYFGYIGASMPLWFLEGDAVSTETELTQAGRGRQPHWIMPFRTAVLSGKKLSYSKAYFGSEKDITPGYYQLGYLMNSHLQKEFGNEVGDKLLTDIQKRPLRFYPFSNSLKKFTGKNTNNTYLELLKKLEKDWQQQRVKNPYTNYASLNKTGNYETNYYLPTQLPNHKILTIKHSKAETPAFVLLSPNYKEKLLFKIGVQEQPWFSYGNDKIVWDERREDPRYKQRSYNVVCIYDLTSGKKHQLTHKTRLFSPSISADGKMLIAVQVDLSNHSQLVKLDLETGKVTDSIANPTNDHLQTPSLNADGTEVTWISVNENGKSLWMKKDNQSIALIENSRQQLSRPMFFGDKIAFNAHFSGINNIYEVYPATKEIKALTAAEFGAFNAGFDDNQENLIFNFYQPTGYHVAKIKLQSQPIPENHFVFYGIVSEKTESVFTNVPDSTFNAKPYRPVRHAINFHSISPAVTDDAGQVGLELKSDDLLNTTSVYAGVSYESSLGKMNYYAGVSYKALYPVLSINYRNRPRLTNYRFQNKIHQAQWREDYISLSASVPLSFSSFNHRFNINSTIGTYYVNRNLASIDASRLAQNIKFPLTYRFSFNHQIRSAERDIAPKWAQIINLKYQHLPFEDRLNGRLFTLESYFYFPGLAKNHTFLTSFNYQHATGTFSNVADIPTVYGYNQVKAKHLLQNSLLLNYRAPLWHPDLEIGALAYVRNIRATFFGHYENIGHHTSLMQPKTYGLEMRSDMNILRYQPVVDLGVRLIFVDKIYNQNPILELLLNYQF